MTTQTASPDDPGLVGPVGTPAVTTWRVVRDVPRSGAENMALDHALARAAVRSGVGVLRLYGWTRPTVTFGRNEPALGRYSVEEARERGIDFVRRPTGGRAVLHSDELTYALAVPAGGIGRARAMYARVNQGLAGALRSLGIEVQLASDSMPGSVDSGPCFQSPAAGEVTVGGRKLVGSAQARVEGALLQHGSILMSDDQRTLARLGGRWDGGAPAMLETLAHDIDVVALGEAVVGGLRRELGGSWEPAEPSPAELEDMDALERDRYGKDSWTWRR